MRKPSLPSLLLRPGLCAALLLVGSAGCKSTTPKSPPSETTAAAPAVAVAPPAPAAPQPVKERVDVTVTEQGFVPEKIPAKAGQPITLAITRKAERTCATEILFAGQEGKTDLPLNKTVEVTYTPKASGEVKFGCAMGMMIGGVLDVRQ